MNNDLIGREALKETIDKIPWYHINSHGEFVEGAHDDGDALYKAEDIYNAIDNAPTVNIPNYGGQAVPDMLQGWRYDERPQGEHKPECGDCDYRKFTKRFIDGVVDVMTKNGISSLEELNRRLNIERKKEEEEDGQA